MKNILISINEKLPYVLLGIIGLIFLRNLDTPLMGMHSLRQADTMMTAVLYCQDEAPFMEPRISFRGGAEKGISIGEFPIFSYLMSFYCKFTGGWSDAFPKVLVYLCFALAIFLWIRVLFEAKESRKFYVLLSLSLSAIVTQILIPIPDAFVFLLYAIAASLLSLKSHRSWVEQGCSFIAIGLLVLGFITRPYIVFLIPYLYWITKRKAYLFSLVPCLVGYYFWYKQVVPFGELTGYYYTGMPSVAQMIEKFPRAMLDGVYFIARDQFGFFGIILFLYGLQRNILLGLYVGGVLVGCYFLRGEHMGGHAYYFIGCTLIIVHLMTLGFSRIVRWQGFLILNLMILVLIVSDQHHWHKPDIDVQKIRTYVDGRTSLKDRICTRGFGISQGFYYALRSGWSDAWLAHADNVNILNPWPDYRCPPGVLVLDRNDFRLEIK